MDIDYDKELFICLKCIKDLKLKKYFLLQNKTKHICSFCHEEELTLDIFDDSKFYNFLRALIRYYYWEDEYNTHFGGDSLYELFTGNNYFLNSDRVIDDIVMDGITCNLEDYKFDNDSIIELYYGHDGDGNRLSFNERYQDRRDSGLLALEDRLLKENYFLFEESIINKVNTYKSFFESNIMEDEIFYRARIGYSKIEKNDDIWRNYTDNDTDFKYVPYKNREISAPPVSKTLAGRLNKQGVSFLYLATNIDTALAEIRPHPGHKVSIGSFKSLNKLSIVDFDMAFIRLSETEESLNTFTYLNHIDQLLSRPITPEERHLYIITQFFADIFRKIGFDGILFSSSVGNGQNLLIFNPSNFKYIEDNSNTYAIRSLKYTTKKLT